MRWLALVVLVPACQFDPNTAPPGSPNTPDAPADVDAAVAIDALVLGEWGPPVLLENVNSPQNDDDPSLTGDLLELYFASNRTPTSPDEDLYVARRASVAEPFGAPALVPVVNTQFLESNADITPDGLTLIFTSDRAGGDDDLYISTRPDRGSTWSTPVAVAELNSTQGEYGAVLSTDAMRAVLCSNRGVGDEALYISERPAPGQPFGEPAKIFELDTNANECDAMQPDGSTIYFTRGLGAGDLDLFVATRTGNSFSIPLAVNALNTTMRDGDPWVSADQRTMLFASNRGGGPTDDLYISTR